MKKALLIVDVQRDFCLGGALAVIDGDQVVQPLNKMISHAKANECEWLTIASRDWHPRQTTHFAEFRGKWPIHCVQNTPGADFHPKLNIGPGVVIISKGTTPGEDGYSAFEGHTASGRTLEEVLRTVGIKEIYIGGLATDYCVKATAFHALLKGFKTFLLLDACRAVNINLGDSLKAMMDMKDVGIIITSTEKVLNEAG